ncbi:MAG: F0F1 ATP synthase subunit B [Tepidanaerobacteraceae bacterium]|nr:F0F1 ATP synthase subunit B [Tepidanaerobacteraceae bacterium]
MFINPYTFVIQLINIAILFYFLKRFLFHPLSSFLENRKENIRQQYGEAERQKLESEKIYNEYRSRLDGSKEEIRAMIKTAKKEAEQTRRSILEQAQQEAELLISKAKGEMERQKDKVYRELMEQSVDFSLVMASKVLEQKISKEEHHGIIRQVINRIGDEREWVQ